MRGLLVMGHEARSLQPCNDDRTLWVSARGALQQQLTAAVHQLTTRPYEEVYVELDGEPATAPAGEFAKGYDGTVEVREVRLVSKQGIDACRRERTMVRPSAAPVVAPMTYVFVCNDNLAYTVRASAAEAWVMTRLDSISKTPPQWGVLASALGYALCGAGLAVLFSLTWWDVLFATLLSLVVYGMVWFSGRSGPIWAEWLPLSSAFVAGVLAATARMWVPELNVVMVIVAAVAVLLPGYTISQGLIELVGKHVTSGSANLMSGIGHGHARKS